MKRQQENIQNGIMFFIPLSDFLVNKLEIIGEVKLVLDYNESRTDSQIRVKIYYQDKYSGAKDSIDERPRLSPERGRIKFVLNDDHIENLIKNGENEKVEFKGYQNLVLKTSDKDDLTKTVTAFANTFGGVIMLGVNEDKKIIGFKQEVSIESIRKQLVNLILDWCDPQIGFLVNDIDMQNGERLILIHINKGTRARLHSLLTTARASFL